MTTSWIGSAHQICGKGSLYVMNEFSERISCHKTIFKSKGQRIHFSIFLLQSLQNTFKSSTYFIHVKSLAIYDFKPLHKRHFWCLITAAFYVTIIPMKLICFSLIRVTIDSNKSKYVSKQNCHFVGICILRFDSWSASSKIISNLLVLLPLYVSVATSQMWKALICSVNKNECHFCLLFWCGDFCELKQTPRMVFVTFMKFFVKIGTLGLKLFLQKIKKWSKVVIPQPVEQFFLERFVNNVPS